MTMEIRQALNGDFDISSHEDTSFGVIIQSLNQFLLVSQRCRTRNKRNNKNCLICGQTKSATLNVFSFKCIFFFHYRTFHWKITELYVNVRHYDDFEKQNSAV